MEKMPEQKFDIKKTYMSDRGLLDYLKGLEIQTDELEDKNGIILDLGAGAAQNLAKDIRELNLNVKVISVDPRLALTQAVELGLPGGSSQTRKRGKINPEVGSLAAYSDNLPFKDNSFEDIYAFYSVPFYLENQEEIQKTLTEMIRVTKNKGEIRAFPILKEQVSYVRSFLSQKEGIDYELKLKEAYEDGNEDWLLIIHKREP